MSKNRIAKRVAVAAGFLFLCAPPGLTRAQSSPPTPAPTPRKTLLAARPKKDTRPTDDFAGLNLTDHQKAQIDQVHQSMKTSRDAVVKDEKLTADQRNAMLEGYERMERGQVFELLTTEQRKEVRERIRARRAAEHVEQKKHSPPK